MLSVSSLIRRHLPSRTVAVARTVSRATRPDGLEGPISTVHLTLGSIEDGPRE